MKVKALSTKILATDLERGEQKSAGGIVLLDDDGKVEGVRARWMQVYSKGKEVTDEIQEGDWIYVEHGRWTRGMELREDDNVVTLWGIDPDGILLVSSEKPVIERVMKDTVSEFAPPGA
jgi:co-chaperonin GroES (HSP10)